MRKTSLIMLGAFLGAGTSMVATQTDFLSGPRAVAASAETYRQLSLFGDVFEKVRTDYVEKPDESKMIEAAVNGMLTSLDPHSSYMDARRSATCRPPPAASSAGSASRSRWRTA